MDTFYHATQLPLFVLSKVCKTCGLDKPLDDFTRDAMGKYGRKPHCKVCMLALTRDSRREYYLKHPGQHKKYEDTRKPYQRQYRRERWVQDPDGERAKLHHSYAKHAEKRREKSRQWFKDHPFARAEYARRRDARKKQAMVGSVNYERILERDGSWCYICEKAIEPGQEMHFDHVIPLDRGGLHSEENIRPSHQECNLRKGTRLLEEMTLFQRRGPD